jgi:hypothetical protein
MTAAQGPDHLWALVKATREGSLTIEQRYAVADLLHAIGHFAGKPLPTDPIEARSDWAGHWLITLEVYERLFTAWRTRDAEMPSG